jgi:hypothetical protein
VVYERLTTSFGQLASVKDYRTLSADETLELEISIDCGLGYNFFLEKIQTLISSTTFHG